MWAISLPNLPRGGQMGHFRKTPQQMNLTRSMFWDVQRPSKRRTSSRELASDMEWFLPWSQTSVTARNIDLKGYLWLAECRQLWAFTSYNDQPGNFFSWSMDRSFLGNLRDFPSNFQMKYMGFSKKKLFPLNQSVEILLIAVIAVKTASNEAYQLGCLDRPK